MADTRPYRRRGITAEVNYFRGTVDLYFGESLVTSWPVETRAIDELKVEWRRDRFVAERLQELFALLNVDPEAPDG